MGGLNCRLMSMRVRCDDRYMDRLQAEGWQSDVVSPKHPKHPESAGSSLDAWHARTLPLSFRQHAQIHKLQAFWQVLSPTLSEATTRKARSRCKREDQTPLWRLSKPAIQLAEHRGALAVDAEAHSRMRAWSSPCSTTNADHTRFGTQFSRAAAACCGTPGSMRTSVPMGPWTAPLNRPALFISSTCCVNAFSPLFACSRNCMAHTHAGTAASLHPGHIIHHSYTRQQPRPDTRCGVSGLSRE